ncbi:MAG: HAD family hydrolase [Clostridia bacterium]|nr:HAD family hydrolase [Clostridia bacterium]
MKYRLIAFDLDGTLLDTLDDLTYAANASLMRYSLPSRTREEIRAFIGDGIRMLMQRAAAPAPYFDGLVDAFREEYALHCQDKTAPYEGIVPLLDALREKGYQLAVLSNKADFATKKLVKEYFSDYITVAVGENEGAGVRRKPAPDALLTVMENFGVRAEETLYVGDSEIDIQTANNAGVDCVSVLWGFKDKNFLRANGAKKTIAQPLQLLELI